MPKPVRVAIPAKRERPTRSVKARRNWREVCEHEIAKVTRQRAVQIKEVLARDNLNSDEIQARVELVEGRCDRVRTQVEGEGGAMRPERDDEILARIPELAPPWPVRTVAVYEDEVVALVHQGRLVCRKCGRLLNLVDEDL